MATIFLHIPADAPVSAVNSTIYSAMANAIADRAYTLPNPISVRLDGYPGEDFEYWFYLKGSGLESRLAMHTFKNDESTVTVGFSRFGSAADRPWSDIMNVVGLAVVEALGREGLIEATEWEVSGE